MKAHPALFEGEEEPKNEGLLFQSTIDIHILNIFQFTVDIHFQNELLLHLSLLLCSLLLPKLRRLALCAFLLKLNMSPK